MRTVKKFFRLCFGTITPSIRYELCPKAGPKNAPAATGPITKLRQKQKRFYCEHIHTLNASLTSVPKSPKPASDGRVFLCTSDKVGKSRSKAFCY